MTGLNELTASELRAQASKVMFSPQAIAMWRYSDAVPYPLQTILLVDYFFVTVSMSGLSAFLDRNSSVTWEKNSGDVWDKTLVAMQNVGYTYTAAVMEQVTRTLVRHGFSPAEFPGGGDDEDHMAAMSDEIQRYEENLWDGGRFADPNIWLGTIEAYVEENRNEIIKGLQMIIE